MWASVRAAEGKLDVDLLGAHGDVHVVLRGLALRALETTGTLLLEPVWVEKPLSAHAFETYAKHIVVTPSDDFHAAALEVFGHLRNASGRTLIQVVANDPLLAGLSGLLRTARLENPAIIGQVILGEAPAHLLGETSEDVEIRYERGKRLVREWRELPAHEPVIPWKDNAVYLITGGNGGLGTIFAREIETHAHDVTLIRAGRSRCDVTSASDVDRLIAGILREHGRLDGVIHAAGITRDNFLLRKSASEFAEVLPPKVNGAMHLDRATKDLPLDFFLLFSSAAGVTGNVGQGDYAAANAFLDAFAEERQRLVARGERSGRTLAIDWPLWRDGGMKIGDANAELLRRNFGMTPMPSANGIRAFYAAFASDAPQVLVLEGDRQRLRAALESKPRAPIAVAADLPAADLREKASQYFMRVLASTFKLPPHRLEADAPFETYGIDSVMVIQLTNRLEETFGALSKTLFFEYATIRELTDYFLSAHRERLLDALGAP